MDIQTSYISSIKNTDNALNNLSKNYMNYVDRTSPTNPFITPKQNVKFEDGEIGYVTDKGVYKPYNNEKDFSQIASKNGCPASFKTSNLANFSQTKPNQLIRGTPMVVGQTCGNEGKNIFVNRMLPRGTQGKYLGCYNNNFKMTMAPAEINSIQSCIQYASDFGYKYYGCNIQKKGGAVQYWVGGEKDGNAIVSAGLAGERYDYKQLWKTNNMKNVETTNNDNNYTFSMLGNDGNIRIFYGNINSSSNTPVLWQTNVVDKECANGGGGITKLGYASFGFECNSNNFNNLGTDTTKNGNPRRLWDKIIIQNDPVLPGMSIPSYNDTISVYSYADPTLINSINPINNATHYDPAYGCYKHLKLTYKCGNKPGVWKTAPENPQMNPGGEGNMLNMDCTKEVEKCTYNVILEDNGNMSIYKVKLTPFGVDIVGSPLWTTGTSGKATVNKNWIFGSSYLYNLQKETASNYEMMNNGTPVKSGIIINDKEIYVTYYNSGPFQTGEYIFNGNIFFSKNGSLCLLMSEGNLYLYTSIPLENTITQGDGTIVGADEKMMALYELPDVGIRANLTKMGNVNDDGILSEYSTNAYALGKNYTEYRGFDTAVTKSKKLVSKNSTQQECQTACNADDKCHGYVIKNKDCHTLSSSQAWGGVKVTNPSSNLYIREFSPMNISKSCSMDVINTDTVTFENYPKSGKPFTNNTLCGMDAYIQNDTATAQEVSTFNVDKKKSNILGKKISEYTRQNKVTSQDIYTTTSDNTHQTNQHLNNIVKTHQDTVMAIANIGSSKIEGFTPLKVPPADLSNSILNNSKKRVMQENYNFILWTVLAITLTVVYVKIVRS